MTAACDYRLWGLEDGLLCTQVGPHVAHVFQSSTGSEVADRHDATSGGEH